MKFTNFYAINEINTFPNGFRINGETLKYNFKSNR